MKSTIILPLKVLFIILFSSLASKSQTIKGTVYSYDTKEPIPYANIYFDGTSYGISSTENGNFEIDYRYQNIPIVISAIGYQSILINNYSTQKDYKIYLAPKVYELGEVIIQSSVFREEFLTLFTEEFLGKSHSAKKCKILNPEDIYFTFDEKTNALYAKSLKPIRIKNDFLGYTIHYYLEDFEKKEDSINYFGTYYFYEDTILRPWKKRIIRRRRRANYFGSRMHFIRALYESNTEKENYSIYTEDFKAALDDSVVIIQNNNKFLCFEKNLIIDYKLKIEKSIIKLKSDKALIQQNGYFDPKSIYWSGNMAKERIGDLLPFDYQYK